MRGWRWAVVAGVIATAGGCTESAAREDGAQALAVSRQPDTLSVAELYERAAQLPRLRSLLVWRDTGLVGERYFNGATATSPANVKSVSKTIIATLVGIALEQRHIDSLRQPIGELLVAETRSLDAERRAVTLEELLSMRAGFRSTSFQFYGAFVSSRNWVNHVLTRPFETEQAGMSYSTGSSHLLSAILTRQTGTSTLRYYDRALATPLGIRARAWTTDPQGIYFGGNEMRMTPREMVTFGRLFLDGGRASNGRQVITPAWIDSSWVPRGTSPWSGNAYGYGWWMRDVGATRVYFAWGYGGQFIFVVPERRMVVVTTSPADETSRDGRHLDSIHELVDLLVGR